MGTLESTFRIICINISLTIFLFSNLSQLKEVDFFFLEICGIEKSGKGGVILINLIFFQIISYRFATMQNDQNAPYQTS